MEKGKKFFGERPQLFRNWLNKHGYFVIFLSFVIQKKVYSTVYKRKTLDSIKKQKIYWFTLYFYAWYCVLVLVI